jgi:hypothetical protein
MPGRYKVLTVGDLWSSGAGAVMNEKGVMITQNDGITWEQQKRKVSIGSAFLLRYLAEHCATADAAVAMLKDFYSRNFMRDGDIYFIADARRGYVLEVDGGIQADRPGHLLLPFYEKLPGYGPRPGAAYGYTT